MPGGRVRGARPARTAKRITLLVTLLTVLACTACDGNGDRDDARAGTATSTAAPTGVGNAADVGTGTPTAPPVMVSPAALNTYRYAIALSVEGAAIEDAAGDTGASALDLSGTNFTINIDGAVVNPDRERSETHARLGFIELALERIEIGDRAWTREAGGEWKPATPGAGTPAIGGDLEISPARIFAEGGSTFTALNDELRTLEFTTDEVHGLAARRYELDPERFQSIFGGDPELLPGDAQPLDTRGTLWVAEASRVPVRIQLTSTAAEGDAVFEMDVTLRDLNGQITIEPPL